MNAQPIITLDDLHFSYDARRTETLKGLSLAIMPGSITAILGPNGAGKTTLLHILLGWLSPQAGCISIEGRPQASYSRQQLSRLIGLVPQSEYMPFEFSLLEYVLLGRAPYLSALQMPGDADRRIAYEALRLTGLDRLCERPAPYLSGGERQLAMTARALAQQPRILLLDEPTSHLDLGNTDRILGIMRSLAQRGVTIVFTTHDPNAAAAIAHNVVLLAHGTVQAAGAAGDVLTPERLSAIYGVSAGVVEVEGRLFIYTAGQSSD